MVDEGTKIGQTLKRLRLAKGYSQAELADTLDFPLRTYQSWESRYISNVDNLVKLCRFYNISALTLFDASSSEYHSDNYFKSLVNHEHETSLSIVADLLKGIETEGIYKKYSDLFSENEKSPEQILSRIILDVYVNHPDYIPSLFPGLNPELAKNVAHAFNLPAEAVTVINTEHIHNQLLREILLAYPGADLLTAWVKEKPGFRLGVSNGYIVPRVLEQVKRGDIQNLKMFPMNFTNTAVDFPASSSSIISSFLQKSEGYGNSMDTSEEMEVYSAMLLADAVIMGIGSFSSEGLYERMISSALGKSAFEKVREAGIIGDLNYQLLDSFGNRVDIKEIVGCIGKTDTDPLIKTIDLEEVAKKADRGCRVLIVSAGCSKALSVKVSLQKGYVNNLLIDSSLAQCLMAL